MCIEEKSETWLSIANQAKKEGLRPTRHLESFLAIGRLAKEGLVDALIPQSVAKAVRIPESKVIETKIRRPIILVGRKTSFTRSDIKPYVEVLVDSLRGL